jgi:hypothetical protein
VAGTGGQEKYEKERLDGRREDVPHHGEGHESAQSVASPYTPQPPSTVIALLPMHPGMFQR